MLENKILTWDNYVKRGRIGPTICVLFMLETEYIDHLMVKCTFTQMV